MLVNKKKIFYLKLTALFFVILAAVIFILPWSVKAQADQAFVELERELGPAVDVRIIIARIIRIALGLLGVVAVIIVLYGGFIWMTAGGNEERIGTAKKILINGAIGLVIILSSFSITHFILKSLLEATGVGVAGPPTAGERIVGGKISGTLGAGIIQSHFPAPNARGVPRNTKIVVTFKEAINPDSLQSGQSARLFKALEDKDEASFAAGAIAASEDNKTFVFSPQDLLGSASEKILYTVYLTADIKKVNGEDAFNQGDECQGARGYCWDFEVSTIVDTAPPRVESVIPAADSEAIPRNSLVQINFSEAVNPLAASGAVTRGFNNISLIKEETEEGEEELINGSYRVSNQYRTVEFISDDLCGVNSCGEKVFCLPGPEDLAATVRAAALSEEPPEALLVNGQYDGLVDMAGNSLDGNNDSAAQGPPADNFIWNFSTSDNIDLTPPRIEQIIHINKDEQEVLYPPTFLPASLVHQQKPIEILWSKLMMLSSIDNNLSITPVDTQDPKVGFYSVSENNEQGNKTVTELRHGVFGEDTDYQTSAKAAIKDIYQNCFYTPNVCEGNNFCSLSGEGCLSNNDCGAGAPQGP